MPSFEYDVTKTKASMRININMTLLLVAFTVFTLIVTINPRILVENALLSIQLTLAIPFLISSSLARTKEIKYKDYGMWYKFGFLNFIIAYSLLINSVGIILYLLVSPYVSIIFFMVTILLSLVYAYAEMSYDRKNAGMHLKDSSYFILIVLLFGLLPVLGVY